jgi:cob(I)alamin adenosyltransferase
MVKIYTKTGDDGTTSLFGGERVPKDALRIEAYGTVDELNSLLGLARAFGPPEQIDDIVRELQNELFTLGADLATPAAKMVRRIDADASALLERRIDRFDAELPPLKNFILPGGVQAAAVLHLARTVCRRAERLVVRLSRTEQDLGAVLVYLNRLSDLLFVLARATNALSNVKDIPWNPRGVKKEGGRKNK